MRGQRFVRIEPPFDFRPLLGGQQIFACGVQHKVNLCGKRFLISLGQSPKTGDCCVKIGHGCTIPPVVCVCHRLAPFDAASRRLEN